MHDQDNAVRLVTRRELSDRWKLSIETLKRRERSGILPCLKLGRGVRYRLSDVEHLEADAEVRSKTGAGALSARPPARDPASEGLLPDQKFFASKTEPRRCVACGRVVTNQNLGGYDGRSALSGDLWCLSCAGGKQKQ
jgi:hypothetical protein